VQYTHARISSILRKADPIPMNEVAHPSVTPPEKDLLKRMEQYQSIILQASHEYNPSLICNYVFHLAKDYNAFLVNHPILKAENESIRVLRLKISTLTKYILAHGLHLLGVDAPERM
jgi:arginyl-tRNA synthetase